jgi:two-component system competent response regulator ComA
MSIVKMIIVDDHPAIAYGTKMIIEQNLHYQVVEVIHSVHHVAEAVLAHRPQIMFIDMQLPDMNGRELTGLIKNISPRTQVVMFSGFELFPMWNQLMSAGVSGILSKSASPEQIMRMINALLSGETVIPLTLLNHLIYNENPKQLLQSIELSTKEQSIMTMVCNGMSNQQMADQISVTSRTIENYLSKIYEKLGVRTRVEAIEAFKTRY